MPEESIAVVGAKIVIHQSEIDRIAAWAMACPNIETGGDLLGYVTRSGVPVVTVAIGPGPKARHETTAFFQDVAFLQRTGEVLNRSYGLQYVGEWHSHHMIGLDQPSGGDCDTVAGIFEKRPFNDFFLCIVNLRASAGGGSHGRQLEMKAGAYHFRRGHRLPIKAAWVVLESGSPIAEQVYANHALGLSAPGPQQGRWTVAPRTTLETQTEPLGGLMNSAEGAAFFGALYQGITKNYGAPEMPVSSAGDVTFWFSSEMQKVSLNLPVGFPDLDATIACSRGDTQFARLLSSSFRLNAALFLAAIDNFVAEAKSRRPTAQTVPEIALPAPVPTSERPAQHRMGLPRGILIIGTSLAALAVCLLIWRVNTVDGQLTGIERHLQKFDAGQTAVAQVEAREASTEAATFARLDKAQAAANTSLAAIGGDVAAIGYAKDIEAKHDAEIDQAITHLSDCIQVLSQRLDGVLQQSAPVAAEQTQIAQQILALDGQLVAIQKELRVPSANSPAKPAGK